MRTLALHQLVGELQTIILQGDLPDGGVLGTEEALCDRYGVTSVMLRQAARVLEANDLAYMRPGNRGGLVARARPPARALATYLQFTGAEPADLLALGALAGRIGIRHAIEQMTLEDAARLQAALAKIPQVTEPATLEHGEAYRDLTQMLADAGRNPLASFILRTSSLFLTDLTAFQRQYAEELDRTGRLVAGAVEAAVKGDLLLCERLLSARATIHEGQIAAMSMDDVPFGRVISDLNFGRTLGEQTARRITRGIRERGLVAGIRLGSERELMRELSVSRSTLRQAIRVLDQYSAVVTRPGPGGGFFVGDPDPSRLVDLSYASLLEHGLRQENLMAVAPFLSSVALEKAINVDQQAVLEVLSQVSRHQQAARPDWRGRLRADLAACCGDAFLEFVMLLVNKLGRTAGFERRDTGPADESLLAALIAACRDKELCLARRAIINLEVRAFGATDRVRGETPSGDAA